MRLNKIKLNKEKHISKHVKQINQIKSNKNTKKNSNQGKAMTRDSPYLWNTT